MKTLRGKRKSGRSRKLRRSIYLLPSILTVGNMFAGFYAIISVYNGRHGQAAVAIGIAIVLDGLDGRIARLAGATSDFGVQLDSLADIVSFGIAPAVLIYSWGFEDLGNVARLACFVFLICGAMRLARFNIQVQDLKHFAGLPIPGGAGMIAAIVHFFGAPPESGWFKVTLVVMTYLVGLLMITTLRYPSLKPLDLSRGKSHLNILLLGLIIAGVVWYSREFLMLVATAYVLSGVIMRAYQMIRYRWQSSDESLFERSKAD